MDKCLKGKKEKGISDEAAKKECAEEVKNKLSPSIDDLKEVEQIGPVVKAWTFEPDSILKSSRRVTGTFHVPKVDKDREIITKAAMTEAIPDFMHLPILHDFHKERVLGLVTKVWEESDAFHFEALFKATHDVDDAWDKVSKGQYDHVSIYGSRLEGSSSCGLDPSQRAVPCISNKIRLDSISACDDNARNDSSSMGLAKGFVIESEPSEITLTKALVKAETSGSNLVHGTQDGVKKKGGNMRVREVDEDDDKYKESEVEKAEDVPSMFKSIMKALSKLVSSDKKVHAEIGKADDEPDNDEDDMKKCKSCMKKGDKMTEEKEKVVVKAEPKVEAEVVKAEVKPEVKEPTVDEIVKAKLEEQSKKLEEIMKAQTDNIQKAIDKLTALEDKVKKIEEQPIQKAAVVIAEQVKDESGYGARNYKAIMEKV
jgi:hypothetical protein